ncbi:hypothetical protein [uncultured Fibrobacter sp.]|uniref:hypothetical protein n=1 Tax=uncultured Fibrobacter sp. TaxID=261512 RepID=UPI0025DA2A7B|nr:hypothetical protein [uncultured Fibrobacter sp.]
MEYTFEEKRLFSEKKEFFCTFVRFLDYFMLFLVRNREFSSCSLAEICKFHKNGDKANAHAGMPHCGMLQIVVSAIRLIFGRVDQGQQPIWGVGRLCLSFLGNAEPRLEKRNDLRLFCILTKFGTVPCRAGVNS